MSQDRVKTEMMLYHKKRKLPTKNFQGFQDEAYKYIDALILIDKKLQPKVKKSKYFYLYLEGTYPHLYTKEAVEFLKSKSLITNEEYAELIKYEPILKNLIKDAVDAYIAKKTSEGTADGSDQALKDYVFDTISIVNPFEIDEMLEGIKDFDISSITQEYEDLLEFYNNKEEIFAEFSASLTPYKKGYYEGYITTTLALVLVPIKLNKAKKLVVKKTVSNPCPLVISSLEDVNIA